MLLSKLSPGRLPATITVPAILLVLVTLLGACGFRPLYGKDGEGVASAEQHLARISIKQIKNRIGQQLRNNLLSRLNPKGPPGKPLYSLSIKIGDAVSNLGVKKSAVVTRGNLRVSGNYVLTKLYVTTSKGEAIVTVMTSGNVLSTSSYDIPQAQYAALAARKDAQARAVREIADDIRNRLAIYFKQNPETL